MGEAKRKKIQAWTSRECAGGVMLGVCVITAFDMPRLILGARAGDMLSVTVLKAMTSILAGAEKAGRGKGPLCLCCDHEFGPPPNDPAAFVCLSTEDPLPKDPAIMAAICETCGRLPVDVFNQKALFAYRQMDPSMRLIDASAMPAGFGTA
jgi:hypothetical protein